MIIELYKGLMYDFFLFFVIGYAIAFAMGVMSAGHINTYFRDRRHRKEQDGE
jgi:hypothetical protein